MYCLLRSEGENPRREAEAEQARRSVLAGERRRPGLPPGYIGSAEAGKLAGERRRAPDRPLDYIAPGEAGRTPLAERHLDLAIAICPAMAAAEWSVAVAGCTSQDTAGHILLEDTRVGPTACPLTEVERPAFHLAPGAEPSAFDSGQLDCRIARKKRRPPGGARCIGCNS